MERTIFDVVTSFWNDDCLVKLHPRSTTTAYNEYKIYENHGMPWEVICLHEDIEQKVLISYYSTALFSSKLLYDKEPIIILLFEIDKIRELYTMPEKYMGFVNKFRATYRHPERVFVPRNIAELNEFVHRIMT